ncbi:MAG: hypothetical protein A3B91_02405 [Candidatus Yanofskybacteria bacterium RIFCSPHIGHO2_02_FULL_41_29]|uniref:Uncharacterized protein n=1 Tax=Candidatus Yanofskybacteria bacterium RIFCSPHIGHO2_01_FULL_41_53 TaxID=1802663 RepID=A0A1F8EFX6_9BACT|nr:MAG: hypothetical protein A2650_04735 [Candidatus Yanofskybacteria bacterium RIFCSPHIGHO2_01_FULL_41_53]OGN12376.1 MAG: hypothetical protein A3B91_02405 [Candidatus Yanofskybacteria bacterium RIFCSPHIGHO2_02_FULL_41_29]OGN16864.1 MAG: hypothetical protein A3F48_00100 [Candidatus Yanofskybacteria bacterium RIFCSPHIGHO2_12_FULL_41_9]OGN23242.1 MAG: hypothetical protein A2916_02820 [Candidatus Yanofskybacteria bacterium RIFCSPLOWO2_01_FULL_41_67]OGN28861.1 MAG: hypothetical protein A3H54_01820 
MRRKNKAQYYIREYFDRPVSKREFLQNKDKEVKKSCVSQKYLLATKTLSRGKIKAYERREILVPIWHKRRKYFITETVMNQLKIDARPTERIQQLGLFRNNL